MIRVLLSGFIAFSLLLFACDKDDDDDEIEIVDIEVMDLEEYVRWYFPDATPVEGLGMYVMVTDSGGGDLPADGDIIYAYYKGKLLNDAPDKATPFDTSYQRPATVDPEKDKVLTFKLDMNEDEEHVRTYIKGWYRGFSQLKRGSKAVFLIPDSLAYGDQRRGIIPPNAALMFEVESLRIK